MTGSIPLVASVVIVGGLIALSAFFSSSEMAIFSLSEEWIESQQGSADPRAETLSALRRDPHRLLVTILVGNNVVNVAIASVVTASLTGVFPAQWAVTVATVVASFVILVFGEIVPKSYGLGNATRWALVVAGPLKTVERVAYPVVYLFDTVTRRMNAVLGGEPRIEQPYLEP